MVVIIVNNHTSISDKRPQRMAAYGNVWLIPSHIISLVVF